MNTFTIPLTCEQFAHARKALESEGESISGYFGELSQKGVRISFSYNGSDTLSVTVEHKPWIFSEARVENAIREWFADV